MTTLPLADGAHLLGIHPKTLHHWLKEAQVPLTIHPTDARITCVAEEDLHQVAKLHGRLFPSAVPLDAASPPLVAAQVRVPPLPENEGEPAATACSLLTPAGSEADLIQKLAGLETKMGTLQEQFAQLALALLQERERSVEQRLTALESLLHQLLGRTMSNPSAPEARQEPACAAAHASSTPSRRTTGSVSYASSDRIQRAGNLRDHQFAGRGGASGTRFARVV